MPGNVNVDLSQIAALRAQRTNELARQAAASAELARQRAALAAAQRSQGATGALGEALAQAQQAVAEAAGADAKAHTAIRAESDQLFTAHTPEELVASLDATVPVALLPVRLETRFFDAGKTLRVRIYPDQVHAAAHTAAPSQPEVLAASAYWSRRWAAARAPDAERGSLARQAWQELVGARAPLRAAYAARLLTPTNLARIDSDPAPVFPDVATRADDWSETPAATALPDRFIAIGLRGGARLFAKWGAFVPDALDLWLPSVAPDAAAAPGADEAPVTASMKWITDYTAAEAAGMAITITDEHDLAGGQSLAGGLDRLLVIGVDWTLSPEEGAARLAALLESHLYTRGLSFAANGTPTNNTSEAAAAATVERDIAGALDPTLADPADPLAGRADQLIGSALALPPATRAVLGATVGGNDRSIRTAGQLAHMLWSAVPGVFLERGFESHLSDRAIGLLRDHVARYLRPGGPLPTLRVARQPYGLLPVVARARFVADVPDGVEFQLRRVLEVLRRFHWEPGLAQLPCMGRRRADGSVQVDEDLRELLGMSATAAAAQFRRMFDPDKALNGIPDKQWASMSRLQQSLWSILFELDTGLAGSYTGAMMAFGNKRPGLADMLIEPTAYPLPVPFVQEGALGAGIAWKENYLLAIAAATRGDRAQLQRRCDGASLLESLAAQAALNELQRVHSDFVNLAQGLNLDGLHRRTIAFATLPGTDATPVPAGTVRVETPAALANLVLPGATGNLTVDQFLQAQMQSPAFLEQPHNWSLKEFLGALDELAARPPDEVDRGFRSVLDGYSYRLDAWYTSMASRRLEAMRTSHPGGLYYGAYGWVDDLAPEGPTQSDGFVAAPSIQHAITAALLRSGFQTHAGEAGAFNIDLNSRKVRLALYLLGGVAQGQSLAALLGYRFERALRERALPLARFILPIRLLCPMRPSGAVDPGQPLESIAARDVVDGVQLIELYRASLDPIRTACAAVAPPPEPAEMTAIEAELAILQDALDAVGDLCLAEGVHQLVGGNLLRSGGALAALDRQDTAIEFDVVRTPRSAQGYTQRLVLLCTATVPPTPWSDYPQDSRARAEPRLNAWIAALLGDPARVGIRGRITFQGEDAAAPQDCSCTLRELGLSPLALVLSAAPAGEGRPTALEQLAANCLWLKAGAGGAARTLELLADPPPDAGPASVGLGALLALLRRVRAVIAGCGFCDGRDFTVPGDPTATGLDAGEIEARASAAAQAQDALAQQLQALVAVDAGGATASDRLRAAATAATDPASSGAAAAALAARADTLTKTLAAAWDLGLDGAIPAVSVPPGYSPTLADWSGIVRKLADQVASLAKRVDAARQRRTDAEARFAARAFSAADDKVLATVELQRLRLRAVFGNDFPVLASFHPANAAELAASVADQDALLGDHAAYPPAWLAEMALVRAPSGALCEAFDAADLAGAPPEARGLRIVQLPHRPGQAWAALPPAWQAAGGPAALAPPHGCVSVALAGNGELGGALAGIVVDSWQEQIPQPAQTAAVSFHFDAPGARPPQAILLACAPDLSRPGWDLDTLVDTVLEAADLARLRLVGPKQMNALANMLFPATMLPDSYSKDVPSTSYTRLQRHYATSLNLSVLGR
jgi:hypothetical protein